MGSGKRYYSIVPLAILALIGIVILSLITRWGIGISPDSTIYIGSARNLLNGHGLSVMSGDGQAIPLTHYPPLFPILLSILGKSGIVLPEVARWLNVCLFGANILLVGLVINRYTHGSIWVPAFGSFLMLTSVHMLHIHAMAWSEPMFIFFGILGLFLLDIY